MRLERGARAASRRMPVPVWGSIAHDLGAVEAEAALDLAVVGLGRPAVEHAFEPVLVVVDRAGARGRGEGSAARCRTSGRAGCRRGRRPSRRRQSPGVDSQRRAATGSAESTLVADPHPDRRLRERDAEPGDAVVDRDFVVAGRRRRRRLRRPGARGRRRGDVPQRSRSRRNANAADSRTADDMIAASFANEVEVPEGGWRRADSARASGLVVGRPRRVAADCDAGPTIGARLSK